jgi:hypothetical protein
MMCGRFALLLLCIALAAGKAQSAGSYTLSGTVVDYATGKPLPDMKFALSNFSTPGLR